MDKCSSLNSKYRKEGKEKVDAKIMELSVLLNELQDRGPISARTSRNILRASGKGDWTKDYKTTFFCVDYIC